MFDKDNTCLTKAKQNMVYSRLYDRFERTTKQNTRGSILYLCNHGKPIMLQDCTKFSFEEKINKCTQLVFRLHGNHRFNW